MAITTTFAKKVNILSISAEAAADLSSLQYCAVSPSGAASGVTKIAAPGGQGLLTIGILQTYDCDSGEWGEVQVSGITSAVADSTFNSGVELTASGTDGKLESASSGDYVIAIALEAAAEADQVVTVLLTSPYQKN